MKKKIVFTLTVLVIVIITTLSGCGSSTCEECGKKFSGQPYQCIMNVCVKARDGKEAAGLDKFCSCSCGVKHKKKQGFYDYSCP